MTAKEAVQNILDQVSPDASYEEIMYSIYLREKIERGLQDVKDGRFVSDEDVEARLGRLFI